MPLPAIVRDHIACPVCHTRLDERERHVECAACGRVYPILQGVPRLFHPASRFAASRAPEQAPTSRIDRLRLHQGLKNALRAYTAFRPPLTHWIDDRFQRHVNQCSPRMTILNLGSGAHPPGPGVDPALRFIHLDVEPGGLAHVLADGQYLPFEDASLDAVFSNAVLEHVEKPWLVAAEIRRVLRPGGRVFINVPFLNVVHSDLDFFRYTDQGLQSLFSAFRPIETGVSAGPSSFLGPFLVEYLLCFVPSVYLRAALRTPLYLLASPLHHLDRAIKRSPHLRVTADGVFFVGEVPA